VGTTGHSLRPRHHDDLVDPSVARRATAGSAAWSTRRRCAGSRRATSWW
jgi:hypothetical protein